MRLFLTSIMALGLGLLFQSAAQAEDAKPESINVGQFEIFIIPDKELEMHQNLIPDIEKFPELAAIFENAPVPGVNRAYFFRTDSHNVLVDTGWGKDLKTKGEALENLRKAGVAPEDVTDILLTHMDGDHIGGMLDNGKPVFPNATVWVSAPELEAWKNGNIKARGQDFLDFARAMVGAYQDKIRPFNFGEAILPGVTAIDASGHTPGHTAYQIDSGDARMLIAGDLIQVAPVQLLQPELSSIYDMDPEMAAKRRLELLDKIANGSTILGAMHIPMISPVKKTEEGKFLMRQPRGMM